jgi:nucleotide-binding universal stress UspA family protein
VTSSRVRRLAAEAGIHEENGKPPAQLPIKSAMPIGFRLYSDKKELDEENMNRILVAIDFSEVTDEVISTAITLNNALQGQLRILHVDDSAPYSYAPKDDSMLETEPQIAVAPQEAGKLERIRLRLSKEPFDADFRLMEGPAVDNILSSAREFGADIIVIGAHEHGKFYHLLFGDTTDSLIRHAQCPIMVVPHKGSK